MFEKYPILDQLGPPILLGLFVVMFTAEKLRPLRRRVQHWFQRLLINLGVAAPSFVVARLLLIPVVVAVAAWAGRHNLGLVRMLPLPPWASTVLAIMVLDYTMYWWHWLNHRVPFLWRFHHVHHSDLDLDVTTAFRFHFGEMLLSVIVRSIQVVIAGASPVAALTYEIVLESSTQFHHSNVRLPIGVERVLSWFIMTPRAHGIHHSIVARETNSNFSNFLIWWDRLHRTLRLNVRQDDITIGVPDHRDADELTFWRLVVLPFRNGRRRDLYQEAKSELIAKRDNSAEGQLAP